MKLAEAFYRAHRAYHFAKMIRGAHFMHTGLDRHDLNCKYLQIVISRLLAAI